MTNRTLTALIIRVVGFALLVKIFDFFGSYFMSIYLSTQLAELDLAKTSDSFDKLYLSGSILSVINLVLSVVLIFKADWIAKKIDINENEIKMDLTPNSIMRIVIATVGIIYCARTLYITPIIIENLAIAINWKQSNSTPQNIGGLTKYVIQAVIGVLFISRSEQISKFALKKMNTE